MHNAKVKTLAILYLINKWRYRSFRSFKFFLKNPLPMSFTILLIPRRNATGEYRNLGMKN